MDLVNGPPTFYLRKKEEERKKNPHIKNKGEENVNGPSFWPSNTPNGERLSEEFY